MILPRPFTVFRFVKYCKYEKFKGPLHTETLMFGPGGCFRYNTLCINKTFWDGLSYITRWFIALHESFHGVQPYKSERAHRLTPNEWEADLYACRIMFSAGIDLEKLLQEFGTHSGRLPYLPLWRET